MSVDIRKYPARVIPVWKRCSLCKETRLAAEFRPDERMLTGLASRCRPCDTLRLVAAIAANPQKWKDANARYRIKHRERIWEQDRQRRKSRPKEWEARHLRRKFGITAEQRQQMLDAQGGRCAICRTDNPGTRTYWHVDHDHVTGRNRGLLCHSCNVTLGKVKESTDTLRRMIAYLEAYSVAAA